MRGPSINNSTSQDLELVRAQAATQALAVIGLPAAVSGVDHRLLAANELMLALMPAPVCCEEKRLRLADSCADRALSQALSDPLFSSRTSWSVPMIANGHWGAMVAQIIALDHARDDTAPASYVVIMTPVRAQEPPPNNVIRGVFGLTRAETRVARMIAGGETVKKIAAASRTGEATIRSHLKAVFAKVGVSRQIQLANLLNGMNAGRESHLRLREPLFSDANASNDRI